MFYIAKCTSPNGKTEYFAINKSRIKEECDLLKKYYETVPYYNWWPITLVRKWHSIQYDYYNSDISTIENHPNKKLLSNVFA